MNKIITDGYPEDNQIFLDSISCTYIQEPDCTEDREGNSQEITLSSRDGGGGKFIHIKTTGWSICSNLEDDLIPLIEDFKHRMNDEYNDNSGHTREKVLETGNN